MDRCSSTADVELQAAAEGEEHVQWQTAGASNNPKDWPDSKKWLHILLVASMAMATPLASSIHTPAIPLIAFDFSIAPDAASLTVPVYVLGFATGPFVFSPLSKVFGRKPNYNAANLLLLCGHLGCALAPDFVWLVAFRFVAGCAGACAITQGSGTIADIIEKEKRGRAVAVMAFGTVWAPVLGPVVGGMVAERFGWRGCFWVLVCVVAINTIVTGAYMDETSTSHRAQPYEPLLATEPISPLLARHPDTQHPSSKPLSHVVLTSISGPFHLLLNPVYLTTALLSAFFYSIQIFLYTDLPTTYKTQYGFTPSQTGLSFLGIGIGMTVGLLAFGLFSDRIMIMVARSGQRKPEHRLPLMIVSTLLLAFGLVIYVMTARPDVTWMLPIMGNGLTGAGLYSSSMTAATYLIDVSPERAVDSAILLAMIRFPTGAAASVISEKLVPIIGRTAIKGTFASVTLLTFPVVHLLYVKGERLRAKFLVTAL